MPDANWGTGIVAPWIGQQELSVPWRNLFAQPQFLDQGAVALDILVF